MRLSGLPYISFSYPEASQTVPDVEATVSFSVCPQKLGGNFLHLVPCTVKLGIVPFLRLISGFYCSSSCLERMPHQGRGLLGRGKMFLEQCSGGCPSLRSQFTHQITWLSMHLCWSNLDNWIHSSREHSGRAFHLHFMMRSDASVCHFLGRQ